MKQIEDNDICLISDISYQSTQNYHFQQHESNQYRALHLLWLSQLSGWCSILDKFYIN